MIAIEKADLWPDEQVIWAGNPARGPMMRWGARTGLGAAVAFYGGTVLYGWRDLGLFRAGPLAVGLVAAAALGAAAGTAWAGWLAPRTAYALTNRRILFLRGRWMYSVARWLGIRTLAEIRVIERPDGTGDVMFTRDKTAIERLWQKSSGDEEVNPWTRLADMFRGRFGVSTSSGEMDAFLGIPEPHRVRELIARVPNDS
ncbi:MAG TPA: hypothetical protein VKC15_07675 [Gemmatimonadales bacterium]|nr:hypothetical protein [Gemmatimonadales bacterium]